MAESLGKVIETRRVELGLSQRDLAKSIKRSNSTVSRIESDNSLVPDNTTLRAIADVLKMDYNYLLAINKQIDDEPEIRVIQRATKNMTKKQLNEMMSILKKQFKEAFSSAGKDKEEIV